MKKSRQREGGEKETQRDRGMCRQETKWNLEELRSYSLDRLNLLHLTPKGRKGVSVVQSQESWGGDFQFHMRKINFLLKGNILPYGVIDTILLEEFK